MGTFKDLLAWQKSLTLAKKVYQVTGNLPQCSKEWILRIYASDLPGRIVLQ